MSFGKDNACKELKHIKYVDFHKVIMIPKNALVTLEDAGKTSQ